MTEKTTGAAVRPPHSFLVRFEPHSREIQVAPGSNLLQAAMDAGVYVQAACGGGGFCGKCKVRIETGEVESPPTPKISDEEHKDGFRLACQTRVWSDLLVRVPVESQLDRKVISRTLQRVAGGRRVSHQELESLVLGWCFNPALRKVFAEVDPPTLKDNRSDLSRLLIALKKTSGYDGISVDSRVLHKLPFVLREADWKVTATLVQTRMESQLGEYQLRGSRRTKLIDIEPGDKTAEHYSIVLDIGTTTVWGQLLDLNRRKTLSESSDYNSQIQYGDDVITRIVYSQKPQGLKTLQTSIVGTINGIIGELIARAGVNPSRISHMTAAGNTVMTHLLLGLDPKYIRESPYTPVANYIPPVRAVQLGLQVGEHVHLYTFPSVASYVGGDIVSGVLGSGIYQRKPLTLYIDIGTNGEIVIGNSEWMVTAACSAGPAFEGGGIRHGMRATTGALEDFRIDPVTYEPMLLTIGMARPKGICGSGLINMVAEFLEHGVITPNGKFNDLPTPRIRAGADGKEYVLAYAGQTATGSDLVITEVDIDNLMRAKAAMYAGYGSLLQSVGLSIADLEQVVIAGAFGSFIDLERAITIGLLPELPLERFLFIGNGSLLGARLISFCNEMLDDADRVCRMMTNIELSDNPSFMDNYMAALFLPHTDEKIFPGVAARLEGLRRTV
ncbi:MAG TPA: ASKHA domain-containing protein [Thermodesulfobacteriota bacterium]|nr:ASKHA domain-containing protein [Thermodesulfobacteriota bacterium]